MGSRGSSFPLPESSSVTCFIHLSPCKISFESKLLLPPKKVRKLFTLWILSVQSERAHNLMLGPLEHEKEKE